MRVGAASSQGDLAEIPVGMVVQIVHAATMGGRLDRSALDPMNVTMIVVKLIGKNSYTCASKAGILKNNIQRSYITACPEFDVMSHDLDGVLSIKHSIVSTRPCICAVENR